MSSTQTADDMFNSITGFDEIAVVKFFDCPLSDLIPSKDRETGKTSGQPFIFQRALAFIDIRRSGATDRDAYKQAMELSIAEANGYFADPEPDVDPEDPDSAAGKDDEPSD